MAWSVRPEFFSQYEWNDLVYVSQISSENGPHFSFIQTSGQIVSKPKRFVFHIIQQFDRSARSGRVNESAHIHAL
jgi:hypothetical protein